MDGLHHLLAMFDLDRSLENKWAANICWDCCPTLTCSNGFLFVMSLPDLQLDRESRMFCRFLTVKERFLLQGHRPELSRRVSCQKATVLTGNAFPVPMLSAVLSPLLAEISASGVVKMHREASVLSPSQLSSLSRVQALPAPLSSSSSSASSSVVIVHDDDEDALL